MKEKNLLVTLADKNYVKQAKQLFSSVYWNAGWKGDYMLLSHEIPEKDLKWFREKGILIYKCNPIVKEKKIAPLNVYPSTVLSKLYLFTPYFKNWGKVIFLDSDMIVRDSLEELLKIKRIGSVNIFNTPLSKYFVSSEKKTKEYKKLKKKINIKSKAFNSAIISINTKKITKNTFESIMKLFKKYRPIIAGDDPLLNIYFYKQWKNFPETYNVMVKEIEARCNIPSEKMRGIIIHFCQGKKPWEKDSPFYKEWENNYKLSKKINLKKLQKPKNNWNKKKAKKYSNYLKIQKFKYEAKKDFKKLLGSIGLKIKKYSPKTYHSLKKIGRSLNLK